MCVCVRVCVQVCVCAYAYQRHRFKDGGVRVQAIEDVFGIGALRRGEDVLRAEQAAEPGHVYPCVSVVCVQ